MPSRSSSPQGSFEFALRHAAALLRAPGQLAAACSQAQAIAELALARPESMGPFHHWVSTLSSRAREAESCNEMGPITFAWALCDAMADQEQAWMDTALERAAQSDAKGLFCVFQALFFPCALQMAFKNVASSSSPWSRAERSRVLIVSEIMSLIPDALAKETQALARESPLNRKEFIQALVQPLFGATPGSMALFLSESEANEAALAHCLGAYKLSKTEFEAFSPMALKVNPDLLSSGAALGVPMSARDPRLPEPFVSSSLARDLLAAWRPGASTWERVGQSANLANWACQCETAIEAMTLKIPRGAQWPHALTGYFSLRLPDHSPLPFTLLGDHVPPISASDCALLCGRQTALRVFTERFGEPSLERLSAVADFVANAQSERHANAFRSRLIELESHQISQAALPAARSAAAARRI